MVGVVAGRRGWYAAACACLLVAAAGLRFYDLPGAALRYDEAAVALISRGSLAEVVGYTRYTHHIPIVYPLALWGVQKATVSELGVRFMPAAASLLTVAALLFWMPRLGVARRAAFMAALLAAVSAAAIEHAQDAREYSVDALAAVALIGGALQYLRDGKRALLCGALIVGPLLQYGLALFGMAALGAALLLGPGSASHMAACGGARGGYAGAVWGRLRSRVDLLLPMACFGVACAVSWWVTLRYQLGEIDRPSSPSFAAYYYQGGYDAWAVVEFAVSRTWWMASYHMPPIMAGAALLGIGALLALRLLGRRLDAVALLALLAVGTAICAALLGAYPLGGMRHCLYLGPAVFLAAGSAFHWAAVEAGAIARRAWVGPALGVAAVAAIAVVGATAIYQYRDYLYYSDPSMKQILAALDELEREGDAVYVSRWEVPAVEFYKGGRPANYIYGEVVCWGPSWGECASEMLDEALRAAGEARRIWLVHNASVSAAKEIAAHSRDAAVVEVAANGREALLYPRASGLPAPHYDRQVDRRIKRHNHNSWPRPHSTLHLVTGWR